MEVKAIIKTFDPIAKEILGLEPNKAVPLNYTVAGDKIYINTFGLLDLLGVQPEKNFNKEINITFLTDILVEFIIDGSITKPLYLLTSKKAVELYSQLKFYFSSMKDLIMPSEKAILSFSSFLVFSSPTEKQSLPCFSLSQEVVIKSEFPLKQLIPGVKN